jgi:hypothetical protein
VRRLVVEELRWKDYKRSVKARLLATLVVLACCWQASLSCLAELLRGSPSHETVRKALHANLPARPRELLDGLLLALRRALPPWLVDGPVVMALDLHQRPYYGRFTRGVTRRQKKKSTKKSFTYATLAVLTDVGTFTVGLMPVRPHMRLTTLLDRLLGQAEAAGVRPLYLLMDKEFYAAEVFAWLQNRAVPFLVPAKKRGKAAKKGGKAADAGTGNAWLFDPSLPVGWYEYAWETRLRVWDFEEGVRRYGRKLAVTVAMCVTHHAKKDKRLVYASSGLGRDWSPAEVRQAYRQRFAIETSYRQLGQCLARTNTTDERVRLLHVGLALLLVNVWACLHAESFPSGPRGQRRRCLASLRLSILTRAIVLDLDLQLAPSLQWQTQRPMPEYLTDVLDP